MYFSGWMTDVHYSYWCYSISGLCDILVPPSITCSKWLSSHDNRTGALLRRCRCFLCVCNKSNDQLGLCNNCRQHSIRSHIHKMYSVQIKLLIMSHLPHVFYPPWPSPSWPHQNSKRVWFIICLSYSEISCLKTDTHCAGLVYSSTSVLNKDFSCGLAPYLARLPGWIQV